MREQRSWTAEEVETITKLWGERHSAATIAKFIGRSRCAVMGKISRLGLSGAERNKRPITLAGQVPHR